MIKTVVFDLYNVLYPYTEEAEFVVADLRSAGKKLAAISSMSAAKINEIAMKYDIRAVLSAQDTPYSKRDTELYKFFLDKFGLKAEECLFVDDEAEKIAAAEKAGLQTFLLSDGRSLKELLNNKI